MTPKQLGRMARRGGICAPTLDENLARWMVRQKAERKHELYIQWWEGWYEALDESLSLHNVNFTKNHSPNFPAA